MIVMAIADEETIADLDRYKGYLHELTDPRVDVRGAGAGTDRRHGQAHLLAHSAACTRRRPAGRRCSRSWPTASSWRRSDFIRDDPEQRHHLHHARDRGRRPREAGRHLLLQQGAARGRGPPAPHVLGQVRGPRQQPRRHGADARPDAEREPKVQLEWAPTVMHDLHESQTYLYTSTGTGPVQRGLRRHHHRRVVDARGERRARDDQAGRARACGRTASTTGGRRTTCSPSPTRTTPSGGSTRWRATGPRTARCASAATTTSREWFRPNPPLAEIAVGSPQQHQHPAVGRPVLAQVRRRPPELVPGQLLDQEQALGPEGRRGSGARVGHSRRTAAEGRRGRRGQRPACARASSSTGPTCRSRLGGMQVSGRRLHRPGGPAVPHAGRHVLLAPGVLAWTTRGRTTTPAGRSSSCGTSSWTRSRTPECSSSAMTRLTEPARCAGRRDRATAACSWWTTPPTTT